jgi:thiol-disulfide isomerase/thioredoxin
MLSQPLGERKTMAIYLRIPVFAALAVVVGLAAQPQLHAQAPAIGTAVPSMTSLQALDAAYEKQLHELECRRIADLGALAEKSTGLEADAAFRHLFGLAIARGLCTKAQGAAEHCLGSSQCRADVRALAALVKVLARTDKGEHDSALAELKAVFREAAGGEKNAHPLDAKHALAVGEALLNRLIHEGRYDVAHSLCDIACEEDAPAAVKDHFEDRMARVEMVGKPAPAIAGGDVDGKPVSLADLKGKVVLVDFWATWCPPCVAAMPTLQRLSEKYKDSGFVILGVNVDGMRQDIAEPAAVLGQIRRFLLEQRIGWLNVLNGKGSSDFASLYHVEQIPASYLVGRDGSIVAIDQRDDLLERAVVTALGVMKVRGKD